MVKFHIVILEVLSAMRTAAPLTFVQLTLVLDDDVFRKSSTYQISKRSFLHSAIRDVEIQMANLEMSGPSLASWLSLNLEWRIADDDHSAVLVHELIDNGDGGEVIRLTPPLIV